MAKQYQRKDGIMTADMGGETVMMDVMTGKYYNLGEIGGRIWALLETPLTADALAAQLTQEYNVTADQCRADIQPFLDKMTGIGLILEV